MWRTGPELRAPRRKIIPILVELENRGLELQYRAMHSRRQEDLDRLAIETKDWFRIVYETIKWAYSGRELLVRLNRAVLEGENDRRIEELQRCIKRHIMVLEEALIIAKLTVDLKLDF